MQMQKEFKIFYFFKNKQIYSLELINNNFIYYI